MHSVHAYIKVINCVVSVRTRVSLDIVGFENFLLIQGEAVLQSNRLYVD
jgi:hypothetical protein